MNDRCLFRVWCENKKEWEKDEVLISSNGNFVLMQNGIPIIKNTIPKHHIVEFCTGKKDKNGKLIFWGDLLKDKNGQIFTYKELEQDKQLFCFWQNVKFASCFPQDGYKLGYSDQLEVIGKIHQDSHLLGGK